MAVQAGLLHEGGVAELAAVGPDARVQALVRAHVVGRGEAPTALLAAVGPVPAVRLDVAPQSQLGVEGLGAQVAVELALPLVHRQLGGGERREGEREPRVYTMQELRMVVRSVGFFFFFGGGG